MFPQELGYKMPAEWTPHARTFISWPVEESMCYPREYAEVCRGYAQIIAAIAEFEPVTVVVNPADAGNLPYILQNERINLLYIEHNDAWLRDNGPTFLVNNEGCLAGVNWRFNAWGGKYACWDWDDLVAPKILKYMDLPCFDAPLVLEGGSIHVDGEGTLLTTAECLLNSNRNPNLNRSQIEKYLQQYLCAKKIIWLKRGLNGDETDGHVDNIACFAAPGKILMQVCNDPRDENYMITRENLEILNRSSDARGRNLEIITLQSPPSRYYEGRRLTLSYLNFYFVNNGIVLPLFRNEAESCDREAVRILSATFPERRIRTVDGMAIIHEGGNVHCLTQQMPDGEPSSIGI